ncbi:MAG: DUF2892 domain-containing protein [Marivibrio sp.]|uniref:YgaP family membrane protein n=1 Tax=Marivibrio sp. TaxID=2039719 RepID=UPI0032F01E4A
MTKNMGALDRGLRVVVGLGLIVAAVAGPADPWGYIGVVPLLTAGVGFCPAYKLLGVCTTGKNVKA